MSTSLDEPLPPRSNASLTGPEDRNSYRRGMCTEPVSEINVVQPMLSFLVRPPASDVMASERPQEEVPKESVSLDVKTAFPFRLYGWNRTGETASSTAVPCVC